MQINQGQPFIIQTGVSGAAKLAKALGVEPDLDENGEQLIKDFLIVTKGVRVK
jgi:hypothetical protein